MIGKAVAGLSVGTLASFAAGAIARQPLEHATVHDVVTLVSLGYVISLLGYLTSHQFRSNGAAFLSLGMASVTTLAAGCFLGYDVGAMLCTPNNG